MWGLFTGAVAIVAGVAVGLVFVSVCLYFLCLILHRVGFGKWNFNLLEWF